VHLCEVTLVDGRRAEQDESETSQMSEAVKSF